MKRWFEQLKPQERRWVVIIGTAVFLILNYFFVWPHFGDWNKYDARIAKDDDLTAKYNKEVRLKPTYQHRINELQATDGSSAGTDDQAIDFIRAYNGLAVANGVVVTTQGTLTTKTNEFFLEEQLGINVVAYETNLVKFLYGLGDGNSTIRVRAMSLHPDQTHHEISASITLAASYQKKVAARGAPGAAPTPAPRTATAANPTPSPRPPANTLAGMPNGQVRPMGTPSPLDRTNRLANFLNRTPAIAATNKPGPSIAKKP